MSPPKLEALVPQRERGRRRVQAILDAGAAVLAEKGFEAATMTEVAARSRTAIGSLYRFFPTKMALADALSQRFATALDAELGFIAARGASIGASDLAQALLDAMFALRLDRAALVALLDVADDAERRRLALRSRILTGVEEVLRAVAPGASIGGAATFVVIHLMKGATRDVGEAGEEAYLAALHRALSLYLADVLGPSIGK